ncbi:chorismate-binding protein [Micromonospora sp. NPDC048894]|uniref:chorismate-binding protein n=1 Tax=unclassified Micromonospora TaxID=2617518 RepID=UPI00340D1046
MPFDDGRFARLMDQVLGAEPPAFALLHRPEAVGGRVELLVGDVGCVRTLADLPLPRLTGPGQPRHDLLAMVPYRQLTETGFECHDDGAPLVAMTIREQAVGSVAATSRLLPDGVIDLGTPQFDIEDDEYAEIVRRVLVNEIGHGTGANFVIKRTLTAPLRSSPVQTALTVFNRLLADERGTYWTFVIHTGSRTFVGATPERHLSLFDGTAMMNPISGTLRYRPGGPALSEVLDFLADRKETGELYMVLDEELKTMARVTDRGGRVVGPFLKEMGNLAHTEYLIEGSTSLDVRDALRETMFAPTVTGSPVANACRVIRRYEPDGRGYYSGVAALFSRDVNGGRSLDSAILLRTVEIVDSRLRITVGATLVRDSDPRLEVLETHAKAQGVLRGLGVAPGPDRTASARSSLAGHPAVQAALAARNTDLARFWFDDRDGRTRVPQVAQLVGRRAVIVDAEDSFTAMLAHQLREFGLQVTLCGATEPFPREEADLVVMGPGPGDPNNRDDVRIDRLHTRIRDLLHAGTPFLAVCLSHQVLGSLLGLDLVRRRRPNQGVQRDIEFFGRRVRVGFYNTFAVRSADDHLWPAGVGPVAVSRDPRTGEVHGFVGPHFRSVQFHPESVLSTDGTSILAEMATSVLSGSVHELAAVDTSRG